MFIVTLHCHDISEPLFIKVFFCKELEIKKKSLITLTDWLVCDSSALSMNILQKLSVSEEFVKMQCFSMSYFGVSYPSRIHCF